MVGSQAAYARHRKERGLIGGSRRAVQKALASERITAGSDGQIDFERADRDWERNLNHRKRSAAREHQAGTAKALVATPADRQISELEGESFLEAQRRHEWAKARKAELELRKRRNELVELEDIKLGWSNHIMTAQDRLLGIAGKLAPRVIAAGSVYEAQEMIEREIRQALTSLSEYQTNAA